MSQNIELLGAVYPDVPGVELPKSGGGLALFTDVTPTTATQSDVLSGKAFFNSSGNEQIGSYVPKNFQISRNTNRVNGTTLKTAASLTCAQSGTYNVYWDCYRTSTSGTSGTQAFVDDTNINNLVTTFVNNVQTVRLQNVSINEDQVVSIKARANNSSNYAYVPMLIIEQVS